MKFNFVKDRNQEFLYTDKNLRLRLQSSSRVALLEL